MSEQSESPTGTGCLVCHGTGEWTGKLENPDGSFEFRFGRECPAGCEAGQRFRVERDQRRLQELFRSSQSPARFADARLSDFSADVADRITDAVNNGKGVYVVGPVGVGKTRLLIAQFRALFEGGKTCLYVAVPDFLTRLRAAYNLRPTTKGQMHVDPPQQTESDVLMACRDADWLGLDDLGAESVSEWSRQMVYQVINSRYIDNKPIIVTTNLTLAALTSTNYMGERTTSRLREMCDVVALVGRDRRMKEGNKS